MKITRCAAAFGGVLTVGLSGAAVGVAGAATPTSPVVGHAYVNDNSTGANAIAGFARHADGSLTPLAGSPYATGGAGLGAGTGSQGALELSPNGRFALAVDAGSNQLSVLRTHRDGSLTQVGDPVSSRGIEPVSIAVTPWRGDTDLVYVANAGDGGSNYTGFTLGRHGRLHPLHGSTVTVPDGSVLGDVLFNATGTALSGTRVGTSLVDSFTLGRSGLLRAAPGSPYTAQGLGPIGAEFSPTHPNQLFVSNAHGGPDAGTVSAFDVARNGALTSVGDGPFADHQTAPCWVEITKNGKFLFTSNTAVPSISQYAIAKDGVLTLIGSTALDPTTEAGPVDLRLAPNGKTLYVVDGGSQTVSGFAVNGGRLTALPSSPTALPTGTSPVGIVIN